MSIKWTSSTLASSETMEVVLRGPGATSICLVDQQGRTLLVRRLRVSGHQQVGLRTRLPLSLLVEQRQCPTVPVVVYQSNPKQTATFSGQDHGDATAARCQTLGLDKNTLDELTATRRAIEKSLWNLPVPIQQR